MKTNFLCCYLFANPTCIPFSFQLVVSTTWVNSVITVGYLVSAIKQSNYTALTWITQATLQQDPPETHSVLFMLSIDCRIEYPSMYVIESFYYLCPEINSDVWLVYVRWRCCWYCLIKTSWYSFSYTICRCLSHLRLSINYGFLLLP